MRARLQWFMVLSVLVFLVFARVSSLSYAPVSGLVAWWEFNEVSGTTALDSSGNGNHGTIFNGATYVPGVSGTALQFDGIDDFVEVLDHPTLHPDHLTVELWINSPVTLDSSNPNYTPLIGKTNSDAGNSVDGFDFTYHQLYSGVPGHLDFRIALAPNTGFDVNGFVDLIGNTWQHIAATYDRANLRLYRNGVLVGPVPASFPIIYGNGNIWIAKRFISYFGGILFFQGKMDEVRIYNRALSSEEILARCLENAPADVVCGLTGEWKFDEGSGTTALDSSGDRNHGVILNGVTHAAGVSGTALQFDGADDYVEVPHSASLNVGNQITIEFWMKTTYTGRWVAITKTDGCGSTGWQSEQTPHIPNPSAIGWGVGHGSCWTIAGPNVTTSISDGLWHHVVGTYDRTLGEIKIYADGRLEGIVA
jgi:hypothetical protein